MDSNINHHHTTHHKGQSQPHTANKTTALPTAADYVSNPFLVGLRSLIAGLKTNPVPIMLTPLVVIAGFLAAVIVALIFVVTGSTAGNIIAILLMIAAYVLILPIILGMYYSVAAHSAKDEKISTQEAINHSLKQAVPMLGLIIVCVLATIAGLILLIIPGIIFAVRASLAPTVMYFENLGVFAAIKRSFSLTKGHFIETLGAVLAGGFLGTDGLVAPYFGISQMVGRYHDYKLLQETGASRPKVHWLNYVPVVVILLFVALYGLFISTAINNAKNQVDDDRRETQQRIDELRNDTYRFDSGQDYHFDY